jgi:hypothetical protein
MHNLTSLRVMLALGCIASRVSRDGTLMAVLTNGSAELTIDDPILWKGNCQRCNRSFVVSG